MTRTTNARTLLLSWLLLIIAWNRGVVDSRDTPAGTTPSQNKDAGKSDRDDPR